MNMNLDDILSQEPSGSGNIFQMPDLAASIQEALAPFILLSVIITVIFAVLYIVSLVRRWKVEQAILDIQKTIHEMNERDKARSTPVAPVVSPPPAEPIRPGERDRIIAKADPES